MMTITASQMQALDKAILDRLCEQLADDLLQSRPELVRRLTRAELTKRCRDAVATAWANGLSHRADLRGFVLLSFILGPGFHRHEPIAAILRGTTVADGHKVRFILEAVQPTPPSMASASGELGVSE
jgi:hypothetical protein